MIHTMEILKELNFEEINAVFRKESALRDRFDKIIFRLKEQKIERDVISVSIRHSEQEPCVTGWKQTRIVRVRINHSSYKYYMVIKIEPRVILKEARTVELFQSAPENVEELKRMFAIYMERFIPDSTSDMRDLSKWRCNRIDYAVMFTFSNEQERDLFLMLTKRTSRFVRSERKRINGLPLKEQSTGEGNKSWKLIFYDKAKQIREVYHQIPREVKENLLEEATISIRYEIQFRRNKVRGIKKNMNLVNIIDFLDEDLSQKYLLEQYGKSVGTGDFYSLSEARSMVMGSNYSEKKKKRFCDILELVANAKGIANAEYKYSNAAFDGKKIVKGCKKTFFNYCKELNNPVTIPVRKVKEFPKLENPIRQLTCLK